METLTYNYGDTPEDVIRERHAQYVADWIAGPDVGKEHGSPIDLASIDADDLLTVLDALLAAGSPEFKTQASDHRVRNGQRVTVGRQLSVEAGEVDEECGPMFKVRFADGVEVDAYADELSYDPFKAPAARKLRIDILAALGIDESGAA